MCVSVYVLLDRVCGSDIMSELYTYTTVCGRAKLLL